MCKFGVNLTQRIAEVLCNIWVLSLDNGLLRPKHVSKLPFYKYKVFLVVLTVFSTHSPKRWILLIPFSRG
jgi:hypothetical protein